MRLCPTQGGLHIHPHSRACRRKKTNLFVRHSMPSTSRPLKGLFPIQGGLHTLLHQGIQIFKHSLVRMHSMQSRQSSLDMLSSAYSCEGFSGGIICTSSKHEALKCLRQHHLKSEQVRSPQVQQLRAHDSRVSLYSW